MKFILPKPVSVNKLYSTNWKTGARYVNQNGSAWFREALWALQSQRVPKNPIKTECEVVIELYTCRFQDTDNIVKATFDLLEDAQIVENDNLIYKHTVTRIKVKHIPEEKLVVFISLKDETQP